MRAKVLILALIALLLLCGGAALALALPPYYLIAPAALALACGGIALTHIITPYRMRFWPLMSPLPEKKLAGLRDQWRNIRNLNGSADIRFAVIGDVHHGYRILKKCISAIERDGKYDFALCAGDMTSHGRRGEYDAFADRVLRTAPKTPMIFLAGNHDVPGRHSTDRTRYRKYFGEQHYMFSLRDTLFVAIDNATGKVFAGEYQWLEAALQAERKKHDTLIVFMHKPPIDLRVNRKWTAMNRQRGEKLLALLKQCRADAVFCGHIHEHREWDIDGVHLCLTGGGGGRLTEDGYYHFLEVVIRDGRVAVTARRP